METRGDTPFHEGERAVQGQAGVRSEAERLGRIIGNRLPGGVAGMLGTFGVAVVASVDAQGRTWASLLAGAPGFLQPIDEELVLVNAAVRASDPLATNLAARPELGLLAIDFATRRRIRLNGRALRDAEGRIFLALDQVYGNCPKYIRPRRIEPAGAGPAVLSAARTAGLDARQQLWVAAADTFFIGSRHPQRGADASHRGGPPGFVSLLSPRLLAFPDYPGNNMFNSLGNLAVEPKAGLLFLDFERAGTLQLTGRAVAEWTQARGRVRFEVDEVVETPGAGVRGWPLEETAADA